MASSLNPREVRSVLSKRESLPTLPATYTRLIKATSNPNSNVSDIVEIITYDPILSANVLRVANSSYTGLSDPVEELSDAIMFLGVSEVSRIALSVGYVDLFNVKGMTGDFLKDVWLHSITSALLSWRIASLSQSNFANDAFLAGLLHDIGKLFFATAFPSAYSTVLEQRNIPGVKMLELEQETFGLTHPEAGEELCKHWGLAPRMGEVARRHHDPELGSEDSRNLIYSVGLASIFAHIFSGDTQSESQGEQMKAWTKNISQASPHPEFFNEDKLLPILEQEADRAKEFLKAPAGKK
jgi:HD-like signal output (HDOD) protein